MRVPTRVPMRPFLLGAALLAALLALPATTRAVVDAEVSVARGIEHINAGQYAEALESLHAALREAPDNSEALFYAGVARSRLGEYAKAETLLLRSLQLREAAEPYWELGRAAALRNRCDEAGRFFERFAALGGDESGRATGAQLLEGCRSRLKRQPSWLSLTVGWQHDTNVVLDPERSDVPREGEKADDRALAYFTGGFTFAPVSGLELGPGYSFYGSLHDDITEYNALYHKLDVPLTIAVSERLRPTLGYLLEYTSFDGERYNLTHTAYGRLSLAAGGGALTEALGEYRDQRFWDSDVFIDNEGRTGTGWSAGVRQGFRWGRLEARVHGLYDRDDADEEHWSSRGWRAGARAALRVAEPLTLSLSGEYTARDYQGLAPGADEKREDRTQTYAATLTWMFTRRISATVAGSYASDDSNLDAFTYDRTITGVVVTFGI